MNRAGSAGAVSAEALLELERIGPLRFRSHRNQGNPGGALYGGQAFGQGLFAAAATSRGWPAHSAHGYFLRGGSVERPVDYIVEPLSDGRRFAARAVRVEQDGRTIFHMHCSFHDPEPGIEHGFADAIDVPDPESLPSLAAYVRAHADRLPESTVRIYGGDYPLDLRLLDPERVFFTRQDGPHRAFWVRMPSAATVADPIAQQCLLAFLSDYWLAGVSAGQHRTPVTSGGFSIASLDHAIWFHRPARADQWLLYRSDSPAAGGGRGFARGLLYDRGGRLVASTAQEAVMRAR